MDDFRKDALMRTLREDFGIKSAGELLEAISAMKKLDISQFVLLPSVKGEKNHGTVKA